MIDEKKLIEELDKKLYAMQIVPMREVINIINEQPKVGEWIPCSKCLPKRDGTYQLKEFAVTIDNGEHVYASHASYDFYNEKWLVHKSKVIAWMPLPEPYRPEKERE